MDFHHNYGQHVLVDRGDCPRGKLRSLVHEKVSKVNVLYDNTKIINIFIHCLLSEYPNIYSSSFLLQIFLQTIHCFLKKGALPFHILIVGFNKALFFIWGQVYFARKNLIYGHNHFLYLLLLQIFLHFAQSFELVLQGLKFNSPGMVPLRDDVKVWHNPSFFMEHQRNLPNTLLEFLCLCGVIDLELLDKGNHPIEFDFILSHLILHCLIGKKILKLETKREFRYFVGNF